MFYDISLADYTAIATPTVTYAGINKVTIKDNDSYYDKDVMVNRYIPDDEFDAYLKTDEVVWDEYTIFLFNYIQNLLGGNISIDTDDIERIIFSRANADTPDDRIILRTDLSPTDLSVIDYKGAKGQSYVYSLIFIDTDGKTSNRFTSNEVTSNYNSFFLIDPTAGALFRLNMNVSSSRISKKDSKTYIESEYSQFPIEETGDLFYDSGQVNGLLGYTDDDGNYIDNVPYRKTLEDVTKNKNVKIIKDRAGDVWLANTSALSYLPNTQTEYQEQSISFSFTELYTIDGIEL